MALNAAFRDVFDALLPCCAPPDDLYSSNMEVEMLRAGLRREREANRRLTEQNRMLTERLKQEPIVREIVPDNEYEDAEPPQPAAASARSSARVVRQQTVGWGMIV